MRAIVLVSVAVTLLPFLALVPSAVAVACTDPIIYASCVSTDSSCYGMDGRSHYPDSYHCNGLSASCLGAGVYRTAGTGYYCAGSSNDCLGEYESRRSSYDEYDPSCTGYSDQYGGCIGIYDYPYDCTGVDL